MNTLDGINIVGLTGQSGAGKSHAAKIFAASGIPVINCDSVAHEVLEIPEFLEEMSSEFSDCFDENGLSRKKLGAAVFNDHQRLSRYGSIIFPYISARIFSDIRDLKAAGERLIILDAPTLVESGIDAVCSAVVSVVAPFDLKLRRILERDGIPVELARSRLSNQFSENYFRERSDYVIVNDESLEAFEEKIRNIAAVLKEQFDV